MCIALELLRDTFSHGILYACVDDFLHLYTHVASRNMWCALPGQLSS